jgi:hypothetical protein
VSDYQINSQSSHALMSIYDPLPLDKGHIALQQSIGRFVDLKITQCPLNTMDAFRRIVMILYNNNHYGSHLFLSIIPKPVYRHGVNFTIYLSLSTSSVCFFPSKVIFSLCTFHNSSNSRRGGGSTTPALLYTRI